MSSYFLVLVSGLENKPLGHSTLEKITAYLSSNHIPYSPANWLAPHKALEIYIEQSLTLDRFQTLRQICDQDAVDLFLTPTHHRRKKLLLADMDATIIAGETLDDLAENIGLKDKISAITARAMRGDIDFKSALNERVAMLKDLSVSALQHTLENCKINQGAADVTRVMKRHGAKCYLVSGGFTYFTKAIAEQVGFDGHHGNTLEIEGEKLTGIVIPPILDKDAKLSFLKHYTRTHNLAPSETMAIGDGANDIPMLLGAGLGVGYQPKPLVREQIMNIIVHTDLTSLLYIQGYTWHDIADSTK